MYFSSWPVAVSQSKKSYLHCSPATCPSCIEQKNTKDRILQCKYVRSYHALPCKYLVLEVSTHFLFFLNLQLSLVESLKTSDKTSEKTVFKTSGKTSGKALCCAKSLCAQVHRLTQELLKKVHPITQDTKCLVRDTAMQLATKVCML